MHAARGLASIELSFHPCNMLQGRLQGKQKCGLLYVKTAIFCTCSSNNWETVQDRWVHAARGLGSTELSFHSCNVLRDCRRGGPGDPGQTKNEGRGT